MTQTRTLQNSAALTASGKVTAIQDGVVVFSPSGTNYALHLAAPTYDGPMNVPIKCIIRVTARKVYTVGTGGNFIAPIFGPPRIVQGRVRAAAERSLVIQAGCPIHVDLPTADSAIDLDDGPITIGQMVNIACLPGARLELS